MIGWTILLLCLLLSVVFTLSFGQIKFKAKEFVVVQSKFKWPDTIEHAEFFHDCIRVTIKNTKKYLNFNFVYIEKSRWEPQVIHRSFEDGYFLLKKRHVHKYTFGKDEEDFSVVGKDLSVSHNGDCFAVLQDFRVAVNRRGKWVYFKLDAPDSCCFSGSGRFFAYKNTHKMFLVDFDHKSKQEIPCMGEKHFIGFQNDDYFFDTTTTHITKYHL